MKTTLTCLCFALLFRALFYQAVKAEPPCEIEQDIEQAERNLFEAAQDAPTLTTAWAYIRNTSLPSDAVEIDPSEYVPPGVLYDSPPLTRPSEIPEGMVTTRIFQLQKHGEGWAYVFLGWEYMWPADVADLHGDLVEL